MYVKVKVLAGVRREAVERVSAEAFKISVKEPAERHLANSRVREILAREFGVAAGKVRLISGHTSPSKIFSVEIKNENEIEEGK